MEDFGMRCSKCRNDAIISQRYSGQSLCRDHFIRDLEGKAKREIRRNHWLASGDLIGVPLDGRAASAALLTLLARITGKRRDIGLYALSRDDGDPEAEKRIEEIAAAAGVSVLVWKRDPTKQVREDLAAFASGAGITTIACGKTLDDGAEAVLKAFVSGEIQSLLSGSAPETIRWIYPFEVVPAEEVRLYASLWHDNVPAVDPDGNDELSLKIRDLQQAYTARHPSTRHAVFRLGRRIRFSAPDTKQ